MLGGMLCIQTLSGESICEYRISSRRVQLNPKPAPPQGQDHSVEQAVGRHDRRAGGRVAKSLTMIRGEGDESRYARDQSRLVRSLLNQ